MEADPLLPSFVRPPLDEVAADLQFSPLPIKAADIGAFRSLIAEEYPRALPVDTFNAPKFRNRGRPVHTVFRL